MKPLPPVPGAARAVTVLSGIALILIYSVNSLLLPPAGPNFTIWLLQVAPLALMLPGLLKPSPRAYQWICFLILFYLVAAVLVAFTPGILLLGLLETLLCLLLFASAIVFVKSYRKPAEGKHHYHREA